VEGEPTSSLFVVRPDGSGPTEITREPVRGLGDYSFSPDGRQVIFVSESASQGTMHIAAVDGSGTRTLDVGIAASEPAFRPPDGRQIAFTGSPTGETRTTGLYVVDADGTGLRNLVEAKRSAAASGATWSPDGSLIAYGLVNFNVPEWTSHTRVMSADGSDDRVLPMTSDAKWNYSAVWSNDGTRLVTVRGFATAGEGDNVVAVVPADGSGPGLETARSLFPDEGLTFEWAPDDTSIVVIRGDAFGEPLESRLLDPLTGEIVPAPFSIEGRSAWQRLAPPTR
jgi:Tol biopolymer transport system component